MCDGQRVRCAACLKPFVFGLGILVYNLARICGIEQSGRAWSSLIRKSEMWHRIIQALIEPSTISGAAHPKVVWQFSRSLFVSASTSIWQRIIPHAINNGISLKK